MKHINLFDLQGRVKQTAVGLLTQVGFVPENKVRLAPTWMSVTTASVGGAHRPALQL